ncbi:hypothetical protein [Flavobacterium sp. LB1P62]|uniref:hypothetical protein n=1 Tax=Flavobacterium sp. LB1P62 TaxID=3401715 RepID=UPI003AAFB7F3
MLQLLSCSILFVFLLNRTDTMVFSKTSLLATLATSFNLRNLTFYDLRIRKHPNQYCNWNYICIKTGGIIIENTDKARISVIRGRKTCAFAQIQYPFY